MEEEHLIGAMDIVAAFTALRQDVKTQIRDGRELQDVVASRLGELDLRLQTTLQQLQQSFQHVNAAATNDDIATARQLADALAEVEEALDRALDSMQPNTNSMSPCPELLKRFDELLATVPWWLRRMLAGKLNNFRAELAKSLDWQPPDANGARQGLALILARVRRLMKKTGLERLDVRGQAFDAEVMFAIDTIASSNTPSTHVAEQVRPAYMWRGKLLRSAEVRLAK